MKLDDIHTKQQLLDSLAEIGPQFDAFIASLTPAQLAGPRDAASWTVKDHLAHIATWRNGMTALLQHQGRYEAMGVPPALGAPGAYDQMNDIIFKLHKGKPPAIILVMVRDAHMRFMRQLDSLSDDALHKTYSYYQPNEPGRDTGAPILNWVIGNTSHHFLEHLPWMQAIISLA